MNLRKTFTLLVWIMFAAAPPAMPAEWRSLFDGKTLRGWWTFMEGKWTVEDGAIVGRPGPRAWPGGLFTSREWDDFELELEWKVEGPAETGIWFRRTFPKLAVGYTGRGCQADLNDGKRPDGFLSGSLWCSGRGFVAGNRDRVSIVSSDWNRMRIRAAGNEITIEQNGKVVVQARDDSCKSGFVGIQLPQSKKHAGMVVHVRNIRIRSLRRQ